MLDKLPGIPVLTLVSYFSGLSVRGNRKEPSRPLNNQSIGGATAKFVAIETPDRLIEIHDSTMREVLTFIE